MSDIVFRLQMWSINLLCANVQNSSCHIHKYKNKKSIYLWVVNIVSPDDLTSTDSKAFVDTKLINTNDIMCLIYI